MLKEETIDRHAYELCALSELCNGLRSGDIWITRSRQPDNSVRYEPKGNGRKRLA